MTATPSRLAAVVTAWLAVLAVAPGAAAQECSNFTGESVRWRDPVRGICNAPKLSNMPFIRRGSTVRLSVVRHGIDHTDIAGLNSQTGVTYVGKGVTSDGIGYITIDLALANAALGPRTIRFPHFTGGFNLPVTIVRRGVISTFSQNPNPATWGDEVTVSITGSDIGGATAKAYGHTLVGINTNNSTQLTYRVRGNATTPAQGQALTQQFESSLGDSPPVLFSPVQGSSLSQYLRYAVPASGAIGTRSPSIGVTVQQPPPPLPDLVAGTGGPALRHIAANRKLLDQFCQGMNSQAVNSTVRTITVPAVTFTVSNPGGAVNSPFTVELRRAGVLVHTQTVQSLASGSSITITWSRAGTQAQTVVARLGLVPDNLTRQTYNATGGECVQAVSQPAGYDWQDGQFEVRVVATGVTESSTTNNTLTF